MALVTPTITKVGGDDNAILFTWALTTDDHTGVAAEFIQHTDLCWQATGDFGGTGVAAAQGSNTNTDANFGAMTNASGAAAITYSAAGAPKQQIERPRFVRPKLTTVGTDAAVSVTLMARRNPK
jgi:hypothetical protein